MAFFCPVRIGRKKKKNGQFESDLLSGGARQAVPMGRITGSASIETLVRVGIEKENGLSPDSKMIVLHDFVPCVDDELAVRRGQVINVLYQENDWVYVISENQQNEGFIPASYCTPYDSPIEGVVPFKKKIPRSGPSSVVSGPVFSNKMMRTPSKAIALDENFLDSYEGPKLEKSTTKGGTIKLDNCEVSLPTSNFGYRPNTYSPATSSVPVESALMQKNCNSIFSLDIVSNNANLTGSGGGAPSMVSACSNGARSSVSQHNQATSVVNSSKSYPAFSKTITTGNGNFGNFPSLPRKPCLIGNTAAANTENNFAFNPALSVQLGEMQPFFKDANGRYVVLYTFVSREENDISVERGELVTVLNKDDPNWFWVMRADAMEGFVPAIYICPADVIFNTHQQSSLLLPTSGHHVNLSKYTGSSFRNHHHHMQSAVSSVPPPLPYRP